jgi:hypothetical protein
MSREKLQSAVRVALAKMASAHDVLKANPRDNAAADAFDKACTEVREAFSRMTKEPKP